MNDIHFTGDNVLDLREPVASLMDRILAYTLGTLIIFAVGFFSALILALTAVPAHADTLDASQIIVQVNAQRATQGIPALTINNDVAKAAQAKANDESNRGYFSHTSPEGIYASRNFLDQYVGNTGYSYFGENLAEGFVDVPSLMSGWMNSTLHRANILSKNYTETGVGIASGTYQGKSTVYVVELFIAPLHTAVISQTVTPPVQEATTTVATSPTGTLVATTTAPVEPMTYRILDAIRDFFRSFFNNWI